MDFDQPATNTPQPLAERMRPRSLDEVVGHRHLLAPGKILDPERIAKSLPSLIFWGQPGTGKTSLAILLAKQAGLNFAQFSAVLSGVKQVRETVAEADRIRNLSGQGTVLFVDEIHRFNKAQQDAFLPHVESGLITLIGATTENPSFEVISALLSRVRVIALKPLSPKALRVLLERAVSDPERGLGGLELSLTEEAVDLFCEASHGDGRAMLNGLEVAAGMVGPGGEVTVRVAAEAIGRRALIYDKSGEEHFNLISAFHKSLRGSDPDAALYWLVRMIDSGEDPLYVARRMIVAASEDVGNADPRALTVAVDAMQAFNFLGLPEGVLCLAQAATYIASAPKSNASYVALKEIRTEVENSGPIPVPIHLRNAPTKLMKELGYGKAYIYPHDRPDALANQEYLPEEVRKGPYYRPVERGYETRIKERLDYWRAVLRR